MPILVIDNYDSFTYILAAYLARGSQEVLIVKNDEFTLSKVLSMKPEAIVISPGSCGPLQAGISLAIVATFASTIPILGVCLGHQAIASVFGGKIHQGKKPMHAKVSTISHCGFGLFSQVPQQFQCMRYHSLIVDVNTVEQLVVLARSDDQTVMAIKHKKYNVYGLQFHPESILSTYGDVIIKNFIDICHKQC